MMEHSQMIHELFEAMRLLQTEQIHNPGVSRNVMAATTKIRRVYVALSVAGPRSVREEPPPSPRQGVPWEEWRESARAIGTGCTCDLPMSEVLKCDTCGFTD